MQFPLTPEFLEERRRYALQHCCEECALFDEARNECAHGWPNAIHRRAYYETPRAKIIFCKEFELK
jgi:hypothetical protein